MAACVRGFFALAVGGALVSWRLQGGVFFADIATGSNYCSQLESNMDRANRRIQKIKNRLGEKTWIKPRGMHQKTFDRLHAKLTDAEMRADDILCDFMARKGWL